MHEWMAAAHRYTPTEPAPACELEELEGGRKLKMLGRSECFCRPTKVRLIGTSLRLGTDLPC